MSYPTAEEELKDTTCRLWKQVEITENLSRERDALKAALTKAEKERDDADRRAGSAERLLSYEKDTTLRRTIWLDEAKDAAGYHRNTSFDVVWGRALSALKARPKLEALLREWIETVEHVDGGVYSDMIDKTKNVLGRKIKNEDAN